MKVNRLTLGMCAAVVALAGCSTTSDLRSKMPDREFTSKKSAIDFAGCVADGLERIFPRGVSGRPTAKGYTITKDDQVGGWGAHSAFAADFEDQLGGGSVVKTYLAWDQQGNNKPRYLGVVDSCK